MACMQTHIHEHNESWGSKKKDGDDKDCGKINGDLNILDEECVMSSTEIFSSQAWVFCRIQ